MRALAQRLRDAGEITPAQFNQLNALADQAFRMAAQERAIETAAASANMSAIGTVPAGTGPNGMPVNVNYLAAGLAPYYPDPTTNPYSHYQTTDAGGANYVPNFTVGGESNQLNTLLGQAQAAGALNNPQVAGVVNGMVADINQIASQLSNQVALSNLGQADGRQVTSGTASAITNGDATVICNAGDGTANNGACQ